MTDDLSSWDLQIDYALGQARRVLEHVSDKFTQKDADEEDVTCGAQLAEAWQKLAEAWQARQTHEVELTASDAEADDAGDENATADETVDEATA